MITTSNIQSGESKSLKDTSSIQEESGLQSSNISEKLSKDLKKIWQKPKNIMELADQVNTLATMVLNGKADLETARVYSNLARVMAQMISLEANRYRFAKERPQIEFKDNEKYA